MKKLASTIFLLLVLAGSSFAQNTPIAGKKPSAQAKPKQSAGCSLVGNVKGTKLWAGNCVSAELAAPTTAEPEPEPEPKDAIRRGKQ